MKIHYLPPPPLPALATPPKPRPTNAEIEQETEELIDASRQRRTRLSRRNRNPLNGLNPKASYIERQSIADEEANSESREAIDVIA